jgi:hypothetical protein
MSTYFVTTADRTIALHATSDREARRIAVAAARAAGTTITRLRRASAFYGAVLFA